MGDKDSPSAKQTNSEEQHEKSDAKRKLDQVYSDESVKADPNGSTDVKKSRSETPKLQSIFGYKPVDDTVQYVSNFLWRYCDQENVEVCCK